MATKMTFTVVDNSAKVLAAEDEQIIQALIAIGAEVESNAKAHYVPVDTGRLKNSITYALAGGPANISSYHPDTRVPNDKQSKPYRGAAPADPGGKVRSVYVGSNVEYAEIVENGVSGRKNTGKNYLRNSVVNHLNRYKELAYKALSDE